MNDPWIEVYDCMQNCLLNLAVYFDPLIIQKLKRSNGINLYDETGSQAMLVLSLL